MARHKPGDIAFIAHDDGSISRTVVIGEAEDGSVECFEYSPEPYCFSFEDALDAVVTKLEEKRSALQHALDAVHDAIEYVCAPEYKRAVLAAPLRRVIGTPWRSMSEGQTIELPAPKTYLEPGSRVFCVVTPKTFSMAQPHYRPAAYFVLESVIREARLSALGAIAYRLESPYRIDKLLFSDLDDAREALVRIYGQERGEPLSADQVRVVLHEEEKSANRETGENPMGKIPRNLVKFSPHQ